MMLAYVLRLLPDALSQGLLVGEIEDVDTGERAAFRSLDELVAYLRAPFLDEPPSPVPGAPAP